MQEEPQVIPEEDELPMDPYNESIRRYQQNLGHGMNYMGMHTDLLMKYMVIDQPDGYPTSYTYIPTWDKLQVEHRGGTGGSGARDGNEEE